MPNELELDDDKLAEAALALLSMTESKVGRVWKSLSWDLMNSLFQRGWITDPATNAKSVQLTEEGSTLAAKFLMKHFAKEQVSKPRGRKRVSGALQNELPEDQASLVVLRCTAKLLKELHVRPIEIPDEIAENKDWQSRAEAEPHANV